jgi:hypothetical protein
LLREANLRSVDAALLEARALLDDDTIELIRWPDDDDMRRRLAAEGVPRLLFLSRGTPPPRPTDLLEDWIRLPLDPDELRVRHAGLVRRAKCGAHGPVIDDDGLLWWRDRWVSVPTAQLPVANLLVEHVRELVRHDELVAVYEQNGGSPNPVAVKAMLGRLVKRFALVGLELRSVRGRGYLLDAPNPCALHGTSARDRSR